METCVSADDLLRAIDRFVELSDVRRQLDPFHSAVRPEPIHKRLLQRKRLSFAPNLMVRRHNESGIPLWNAGDFLGLEGWLILPTRSNPLIMNHFWRGSIGAIQRDHRSAVGFLKLLISNQ